MKLVENDHSGQPKEERTPSYSGPTFETTLSDGRVIVIREMKGADLVYMEDDLGDYKETKKSFYLAERLNVGKDKVSYDDMTEMSLKDIKKITELIAKASGYEEEEAKN